MPPPVDLLPVDPDSGQIAFALGRAWRWTGVRWVQVTLSAIGSRAEWLALGLALDQAFRRSRVRAEAVATALAGGSRAALVAFLTRAYVEGRRAGRVMQGVRLGVTARLTRGEQAAWLAEADQHARSFTTRLERAVDEASSVTVLQLRSWVSTASDQATWRGHDAEAEAVATLAEAEFKTWVRAWPRARHRDWHDELEGITVPVDAMFILPGGPHGGARVHGPRAWDSVGDPAEWMNCGHALRFEKRVTREMAGASLASRGVLYDPVPAPRPVN